MDRQCIDCVAEMSLCKYHRGLADGERRERERLLGEMQDAALTAERHVLVARSDQYCDHDTLCLLRHGSHVLRQLYEKLRGDHVPPEGKEDDNG